MTKQTYHMCDRFHSPRRTRHLGWVLDTVTSERIAEIRLCGSCGHRIEIYPESFERSEPA